MKTNRVSFDVAREILLSRPEEFVIEKLPWLTNACRHVWAVTIDWPNGKGATKYLMICGDRHGHHGLHEDVDGGVYCDRPKLGTTLAHQRPAPRKANQTKG